MAAPSSQEIIARMNIIIPGFSEFLESKIKEASNGGTIPFSVSDLLPAIRLYILSTANFSTEEGILSLLQLIETVAENSPSLYAHAHQAASEHVTDIETFDDAIEVINSASDIKTEYMSLDQDARARVREVLSNHFLGASLSTQSTENPYVSDTSTSQT